MARGDRREAIYRDELDRRMFLAVLEHACMNGSWGGAVVDRHMEMTGRRKGDERKAEDGSSLIANKGTP